MHNKMFTITRFIAASTLAACISLPALAMDAGNPSAIKSTPKEYSPYLEYNYPDKVFFGDTHLHTSYSADAGLFGANIGPDEAYRFAKGEVVTSSSGVRARLLRPLDFLVVADHAENLGLTALISESNPDLLASDWGKKIPASDNSHITQTNSDSRDGSGNHVTTNIPGTNAKVHDRFDSNGNYTGSNFGKR